MSKEIIINVTGEHSRIAIVEDGELVELYIENPDNVRTIGDIHLGRVRRILPGIKAAFVDIGQKQDAFLHFSDLSDNLPDLIELSTGKVGDQLKNHLAKAPKAPEDGELDLELETPQEQRAARRRRDIKRTHGRGRRGRGRKSDAETDPQQEAQQENAAEDKQQDRKSSNRDSSKRDGSRRSSSKKQQDERAQADTTPDAPSDETAEARSQERAAMSRSRRSQPPASDDVPDQSPSIIPPEAVTDAPSVEDADQDAEQETQERPKRRRGNRGGRNRGRRNRSRNADDQNDTASADASSGDASSKPDQPEDEQTGDADRDRSNPSRSGRGRNRSKKDNAARTTDETPGEANASGDGGQDTSEARTRTSSRESSRRTDQSDDRSENRRPEKSEAPAAKPETAKPAVPSSRFVIDLTSKPGRVDRRSREEEEEEEEKRSSSRRRRGGRRRGGRNRSSNASNSDNNASDGSSDSKESGEKKGGRSRSSTRNSSRGRGNRSGGGRSGSGRGGNGNGSRDGRSSNSNGARPETYLKQDQKLIVKITKEPISSKGPRVSTDVSLAGRFLVLIPQADYVAVSKKIESSKERRRLRALARSLLPENFGLIVRTVAENRDAKALDTDLRLLLQKWHKIEDQLRKKPDPPKALHEDVNMVSSIIRDLFSEDYDRIVVDDPKVHRNVKNYVQAVAPQMAPLVKLHDSKEHVFRTYKIDGEVRAAFESRVNLPGGGYLFIEHTEAMHVVDVNSGRAGRGLSQEQNSLRVNLESAKMIAKQLRLRDLGGIICVDFIDMRSESARKKVYDELKKEFRKDRAVTKLLPMSDFGVVQITRQRLRPSITTTTNVDDLPPATEHDTPTAHVEVEDDARAARTGPQPTTAEVIAHLERWLDTYRNEVKDQHRKRPILVKIHPLLAAYLNRGIPSALTRWRWRTRLKLKLDVAEDTEPLSFAVRDEKSGKNLTKKYDPDRRDA